MGWRRRCAFPRGREVREGRRANAGRKRRGRKRPLVSPSRPPSSRRRGKRGPPRKPGHSAREGTNVPGVSADVSRRNRVFVEPQPPTQGDLAAEARWIGRRGEGTWRPSLKGSAAGAEGGTGSEGWGEEGGEGGVELGAGAAGEPEGLHFGGEAGAFGGEAGAPKGAGEG